MTNVKKNQINANDKRSYRILFSTTKHYKHLNDILY